MGQKNFKGAVSIHNADGRIRLRWRYQKERYSLSLNAYNKTNLLKAKEVSLTIEQDMLFDSFDSTLEKYRLEPSKVKPLQSSPIINCSPEKSIVEYFEEWTRDCKQMDCEKHTNYNSLRNMLKKWGVIAEANILSKLNAETFCNGTYNRRLAMLKSFISWLVKKGIWKNNPLEDISSKKTQKTKHANRKPFTKKEIKAILHAFKTDQFSCKTSGSNHSHYYPFIYFIFKTGVRNAEAIGLRVGSINWEKKHILIKEVLARSLKSTSSSQRIRKETKNGKERILPLSADLQAVLMPVTERKGQDDLVFQSPKGLSIDDNNFQKRIFKKVLRELKIEQRVLYACRHTFGSRCIDSGITPVMTAFLMGNNPETALRNYTHQISLPKGLPEI